MTNNWRKHSNLIATATRPCKILQNDENGKIDIGLLDTRYDEGNVPSYLAVVGQFFISLHKS